MSEDVVENYGPAVGAQGEPVSSLEIHAQLLDTVDARANSSGGVFGFEKTKELKDVEALTPNEIRLWANFPHPPDALEKYKRELMVKRHGIKWKKDTADLSAFDRNRIQLHDALLSLFAGVHGLGTLGGNLLENYIANERMNRAMALVTGVNFVQSKKHLFTLLKGQTEAVVKVAQKLRPLKPTLDRIVGPSSERNRRTFWAIAGIAEEIRRRENRLQLPESISNPTAAEADGETRRFSDETRAMLENEGYFICELTGMPMDEFLTKRGRQLDSKWQQRYPGLGMLRSPGGQVAVRQIKSMHDFPYAGEKARTISAGIPGTTVSTCGVTDCLEIAVNLYEQTGESLGDIRTNTVLNGYSVCVEARKEIDLVSSGYDFNLRLSTWPVSAKYRFLQKLPLIVPAQI